MCSTSQQATVFCCLACDSLPRPRGRGGGVRGVGLTASAPRGILGSGGAPPLPAVLCGSGRRLERRKGTHGGENLKPPIGRWVGIDIHFAGKVEAMWTSADHLAVLALGGWSGLELVRVQHRWFVAWHWCRCLRLSVDGGMVWGHGSCGGLTGVLAPNWISTASGSRKPESEIPLGIP